MNEQEERRRDSIEALNRIFEAIGGWSYDHRWLVLGLCVGVLGVCLAFATRARFDNSLEAFFDRDDPSYAAYLQYREDFGSDEMSFVVYEAPGVPHGPWNLEVMRKVQRLTRELEEEVPFVKQVTSLSNVEFIEGVPDGLEIGELLEDFPESQQALLEKRDKVLAKPLYVGGLVSADGGHAAVLIDMDKSSIDPIDEIRLDPEAGDGLENLYPQASNVAIEQVLARPEYAGITFYHAGDVPLNAIYNSTVAGESDLLGGITLVVIGLLLLLFFRSGLGVIGPLVVVALSVAIVFGLVGLLGWKLDLFFVMLPTLLIAVGVADSVHIFSEFRAHHAQLGDRREAVRRTLYLVGAPCLLTSLTTATGLGAMSVAPIKAVSHFGLYSAAGVLAAFVLSMTLLVIFLSFGRRRSRSPEGSGEIRAAKGGDAFERGLLAVARFDVRHRRAILLLCAVVFAASLVGVGRIRVDSNFLDEFSDRMPIRGITEHVDEVMGGTTSYVYLFDTGEEDGIKNPAALREIARLQREAERHDFLVKKTYSIVDLLLDLNQSFHGGDPAWHVLPESRELVAQYLLLYEMSGGDELENYVSSDYSRASLELRCRSLDSSTLENLAKDLDAYLEAEPLQVTRVSATGIGSLWLRLMEYITQSQIRSFTLAFCLIAAMICAMFGSLRTGLLAMVPNLAPVVLTLGALGWLDMPLDYTRLLIATVAIGIAVDDTIHLTTRLRHEFLATGRYEPALAASMKDVGRALFITSVVLVAGFLVMIFSMLDSVASFGVLLAATIAIALLANFFLMPALVLTFEPFGPERPAAAGGEEVRGRR